MFFFTIMNTERITWTSSGVNGKKIFFHIIYCIGYFISKILRETRGNEQSKGCDLKVSGL